MARVAGAVRGRGTGPVAALGADRDGVGLDGCRRHRGGLRDHACALHGRRRRGRRPPEAAVAAGRDGATGAVHAGGGAGRGPA
ncbi:hypothetical protein G6F57_022071 [Rhizopus arrhizus]|nr:hypothetical protein G6F57_022071 [Rhizopus arrhizus]